MDFPAPSPFGLSTASCRRRELASHGDQASYFENSTPFVFDLSGVGDLEYHSLNTITYMPTFVTQYPDQPPFGSHEYICRPII